MHSTAKLSDRIFWWLFIHTQLQQQLFISYHFFSFTFGGCLQNKKKKPDKITLFVRDMADGDRWVQMDVPSTSKRQASIGYCVCSYIASGSAAYLRIFSREGKRERGRRACRIKAPSWGETNSTSAHIRSKRANTEISIQAIASLRQLLGRG